MYFDHVAEERQDRNYEVWLHALLQREPEQLAMRLAKKHYEGKTIAACVWNNGAFNGCYRVKYEDNTNVIVRFAALGRSVFRQEKVENEVAVL